MIYSSNECMFMILRNHPRPFKVLVKTKLALDRRDTVRILTHCARRVLKALRTLRFLFSHLVIRNDIMIKFKCKTPLPVWSCSTVEWCFESFVQSFTSTKYIFECIDRQKVTLETNDVLTDHQSFSRSNH